MRNVALRLAYDGSDFVGSQWQTQGRTVQGVVESGWRELTGEERRFTFAGRTDARVHAQGQVVNVRTESELSVTVVQRALNALLPPDVAVLDVWEAEADFHARFWARRRWYRYLVDVSDVPVPWLRSFVVHVGGGVDVAAMHAALQVLVGEHDFAAFGSVGSGGETTVRRCFAAGCDWVDVAGRQVLAFDMVANGFLRRMVRTVVGTVLLVGRGRLGVCDVEQILRGCDRRLAGPSAAAHGLILMDVVYGEVE